MKWHFIKINESLIFRRQQRWLAGQWVWLQKSPRDPSNSAHFLANCYSCRRKMKVDGNTPENEPFQGYFCPLQVVATAEAVCHEMGAVGRILARSYQVNMATLRDLKIKTSTCKRILKELHSYEKEVEREAAKTASMKERGADPYDLKQQENVLAESRMMIPDCLKRLEASLADLRGILAEFMESNQKGTEIDEANATIAELEALFQTEEA